MGLRLLSEDFKMKELASRIGGIIFKKAELMNDFEKIYARVFEKMDAEENEELIEVLGDTGG